MEVEAIAGMIFSLLVLMMIGGFILLFPLSRRLGALLEERLEERRSGKARGGEIGELRETVRLLEAEVRTLSERQAFTDSLLESERRTSLPQPPPPP